ncbi:MAG: S-methyl-5-thioribose-1-phosphate isomerase [Anaerolineae bacterium]
MDTYQPIQWINGRLRLLDQRRLPGEVRYVDYKDHAEVAEAIREMVVRGAPAIGITAAYGMALAAQQSEAGDVEALRADLEAAAERLRRARPTAVNLSWAVDRILRRTAAKKAVRRDELQAAVLAEADAIFELERRSNYQIGVNALPLIPENAKIVHHCNTGPLATGAYGTALRVIIAAHEAGKNVHAYVDETRPRLQGARLTAWELKQLGVPHTVIVDGAAAHVMRRIGVDLCVVGCDRVAANGDTANKIGTYQLALAAYAHGVPFYVAGPTSSIDMSVACGDDIAIEERPADEVTHIMGSRITPEATPVANFAFDITPAQYITAIITERGVVTPPLKENLAKLMAEVER